MNKTLRKAVIAGNWKMNMDRAGAAALISEIKPLVRDALCDVVICVPFTDIETAAGLITGTNIRLGAQNCHFESSGAFTGEISAGMLIESGVKYVIIGHSERRQYFGETDVTVNKRMKAALSAGLTAILCVGETLTQREQSITEEICALQLKIALSDISKHDLQNVIVAYEPVWAIGTGVTAAPEQAQEVCGFIRSVIERRYDKSAADSVTIQYGGSMNAANAVHLLAKRDIDGGLIGGASLKAKDFAAIVEAASVPAITL